jgi:RNA polymerase I-specific transcription initiation factor RRN6
MRPEYIADISIQPVKKIRRPDSLSSEQELSAVRFFTANMLTSEHRALECLLYSTSTQDTSVDWTPSPPDKLKKLTTTSSNVGRTNFIVDDATIEIEEELSRRREPVARRRRKPKIQLPPTERTIDLERVTSLLQQPVDGTQSLEEVLESITRHIRDSSSGDHGSRTLHGFSDAELTVGDIHAGMGALESLSRRTLDRSLSPIADDGEHEHTPLQTLMARLVSVPATLGLSTDVSGRDLSAAYDEIFLKWITSLPADIPGRVRLAKAKLASAVAADLILACSVLQLKEPADKETKPDGPNLELLDEMSQEPSSSLPTFSQQASALPTPSMTPSLITASSHPSSFAAPKLTRLGKYTTFSKPLPTILPRSLNNVLAHWKLGTHPSDYDWMSTSRNLTQKDDEEDEDLPERKRKRLQRRAERHIRRQRKEAAASEARQLASSQAPEIFSASQPMALQVESQPSAAVAESSQMSRFAGGMGVANSQVVAGRYGGRPPAKKKRKQGF